MIEPKKKMCSECGTPQYLFSGGLCRYCWGKAQMDINSKAPKKPYKSIKPKSYSIPSSTVKRAKMEREYNIIKGKMKSEARRNPDARCFFCNGRFKSSNPIDCHHLDGRVENKLTDVKGLVLVHRNCHAQYHNNPIERIKWYEEWMERIALSHPTLYDKESNKYDK